MDPATEPLHQATQRMRVARIEARADGRVTRAEIQRALCGEAPVARIIWELPGSRGTCWLVQVPEHLAFTQIRRFAHLRIDANLVCYRNVDEVSRSPFKF